MRYTEILLGTGSNEGDRLQNLHRACTMLEETVGELKGRSSVYETAPWGVSEQPAFLNQVLLLTTNMTARELLVTILDIEVRMGRVRDKKWGPRLIDIDILFFGDRIIEEDDLVVPHPGISQRRFVLTPLAEVAPEWVHPQHGRSVRNLLQSCEDPLEVSVFRQEKPLLPHRFLAIEGNIGAGKTTLCRKIAADYGSRLILEQFTDNPFLPSFYQNPERYAFPVELFFMTERHKQLQDELTQPQLFSNMVVADYFFVKTLLFARNNLQEDEFRLFQRLYETLNGSFPKPDLLVYLHRPVEDLLNNIAKRGRGMENGVTAAYLGQIQVAYFDYFKSAEELSILVLDLGSRDFENNSQHYECLLEILKESYEVGINYRKLH